MSEKGVRHYSSDELLEKSQEEPSDIAARIMKRFGLQKDEAEKYVENVLGLRKGSAF